jgi:vacuolar-type H+-ATPase subunit E/Vma4
MDDFLQKIQNIKEQKLGELKESLTEVQNRELDPIRREEESLKNLVNQKSEQSKALKESRAEFIVKSNKMTVQSSVKKELIEKFVDDYIHTLFNDSSKVKDLLIRNLEKISDEKGTLNIDEKSYALVKHEIKESWDVKIDNKIKGFVFESQTVSIEMTEDVVRKDIYENNKTALNQILFE